MGMKVRIFLEKTNTECSTQIRKRNIGEFCCLKTNRTATQQIGKHQLRLTMTSRFAAGNRTITNDERVEERATFFSAVVSDVTKENLMKRINPKIKILAFSKQRGREKRKV